MNMMKKMNAVEIARYINNEVGMNVAHIDDSNNVLICADRDFLGNEIFFNDYLFCGDSIYSYINQHGFNCEMPEFGTNSYSITDEPDLGYKCFNPDGKHGHDCKFDEDTGIRKFDEEILKTAVEGLKKALKVANQSKFTISNEVEFMDI
jgi:hypothetical protein